MKLAGNPVELSDAIATLEAIELRGAALDGLQNLAIDYYSIRHLVLPAPIQGELPTTSVGPAAVHQIRESDSGDWIVDLSPRAKHSHAKSIRKATTLQKAKSQCL